jgi:hypothetical protein
MRRLAFDGSQDQEYITVPELIQDVRDDVGAELPIAGLGAGVLKRATIDNRADFVDSFGSSCALSWLSIANPSIKERLAYTVIRVH